MCVGIPGRIITVDNPEHRIATVEVGGVRRQVNIACIVDEANPPEACIGDWVLIHVGFAMSRIDEDEAHKTLQLLRELGEMDAELEAMHNSHVAR